MVTEPDSVSAASGVDKRPCSVYGHFSFMIGAARRSSRQRLFFGVPVCMCEITRQARSLFNHYFATARGIIHAHVSCRSRQNDTWRCGCSQEMVVTSPDAMQRLIDQGMASRTVGSTAMNDTSSRSHSVFTVKVTNTSFSKSRRRNCSTATVLRMATTIYFRASIALRSGSPKPLTDHTGPAGCLRCPAVLHQAAP